MGTKVGQIKRKPRHFILRDGKWRRHVYANERPEKGQEKGEKEGPPEESQAPRKASLGPARRVRASRSHAARPRGVPLFSRQIRQ